MKKIYTLFLLVTVMSLNAQTTVNYPQSNANYDATFTSGGGIYDSGSDQLGMWANLDNNGFNKQAVAFKNFTDDGSPSGNATTMAVGDTFTITLNATRAIGQIGLALLASPTATNSWADRQNNYAVQVNLNGNGGAYDPFEVVSSGGTINASSIYGSTTAQDFKFKFTLLTATTMEVSLNDGAETFNVTLNNTNITGYSVYLADDWNGDANANVFVKPTTEYVYATSLSNEEFVADNTFSIYPNPAQKSFYIDAKVSNVKIYDLVGKLVKEFEGDSAKGQTFNISSLPANMYVIKAEDNLGKISTRKLIKL